MAGWTKSLGNRILIGAGVALAGWKVLQKLREEDIAGQTVLITGGSRGLGLLLARELARQGCRLVICARDEQELDRARNDLEQLGAEVLAVPCDVAERDQVARLIEQAERRFGDIDILVNNAGIIQVAPIRAVEAKDFEEALAVMFWGVLNPTLAVLPGMLQRRSGRIVNITSIGGMISVPHLLPYNCAKFAAVGLSEGLRAELAQEGIVVTTVVPGTMRTGSHVHAQFRGRAEQEFTWFSLGAALPFISVSAERAARKIVTACKRGDAMLIIGLPAKIAERFHGLFPGTTDDILGLVNRVLPTADGVGNGQRIPGYRAQQQLGSRVLDTLTSLGRWAAERTNQFARPAARSGR